MVAKKSKIVPGSAADVEGLARLPDEFNSPVLRLNSRGQTLYANKFSRTIPSLIDPENERINPALAKQARDCFKAGSVKRLDFPVGDIIYELAVVPVPEQKYINIYGRDVTEAREAAAHAISLAKFPDENPAPVMRALGNGDIVFCNQASETIPGVIERGTPLRLTPSLAKTSAEAMGTRTIQTVNLKSGDRTFLFTVSPIEGEEYANIYGRDITSEIEAQQSLVEANAHLERRIAERTASVRLLQNIVLAANSAENFEAALQSALHEICTYTRWPVGHAYIVTALEGRSELVPSGIWHIETSSALSNLRQATERLRFGDSGDLPGQVVAAGREVWVENLSTRKGFRRKEFIKKAGLKSAMAFPVTVDSQVIGVLEFFAHNVTPANIEIIKTLEHVGAQLGSVAERKRAEEALAHSQKQAAVAHSRLTDALEVMGQAFVLFDKDDRMILFNGKYREVIKSFTGGVEPEIGDHFSQQLRMNAPIRHADKTPEAQEAWIQNVLKFRAQNTTRQSTDQAPDGRWYRTEGFTTSEGGTVSIYTDITDSKKNEEELAIARDAAVQANSAKSQFLANMSHELRTPLNAIIGYSELLIDDVKDDENDDYIPDLEKIKSAGKHLLGLINDILDLSKIEVGKIELYIEEFDVAEMLADVANTIKPLVAKNDNVLEVNIDKEIGKVHSDLTKLRQNLFNLLSNAAKFTKKGGLSLRATTEKSAAGELLVFAVADQGIGMTKEQLERVFDPFTQADSSTSKNYGGTGLGLTITREFCRMLGGDVTATSQPGVGTTFTMKVLADGRSLQVEDQPDAPLRSSKVSDDAPLILVIDDDLNVRDMLQRNLAASGYRTVAAGSGKDGISKAKELLPDAITLDVIMPHTDGWAVLTALKSNADTAHIPVVMVTISEDKRLGFSLGASEFLSKPVDRKKLVGVLERFLGQGENRTVLLVEDDKATREIMRKYLANENTTIIEAENGRVGIKKLSETRPALILLDLMMPEMDGFGFIEEYRKRREWHQVPIIVITAKVLTKAEKAKLEGWVDGFYSKLDTSIEQVLKDVSALLPPCKTPDK